MDEPKRVETLGPLASGRERHVIVKALTVAIAAINAADKLAKPASDAEDMKRLLDDMGVGDAELELLSVQAHLIVHGPDSLGEWPWPFPRRS